jgi:hypothetical protein
MTASYEDISFLRRFSTAFALCLGLFAWPSAARADEPAPEVSFELAGNTVIAHVGDTEKTIPIGCTAVSFASLGGTGYALCPPNVVVVIETAPEPHIVERRALAKHLVSLTVKDGVVMGRSETGLAPLADYPRVQGGRPPIMRIAPEPWRAYEFVSTHHARPKPVKPQIDGPEISILGTAGVGVDSIPGPFGFLDVAVVERFPFGLALAAYGNFGAATGSFDAASRSTGPFGGDVQLASGEAHIGLDSRFFAFSIGFGAGLREEGYDVEPIFAIRGRGGELDGFTFTWHTSFMIHGPNAFGALGGMLEFPIVNDWWIGADAELGNLRYGRFMADLRHRVSGKGPHGTLDVRMGLGLAYVQTSSQCDTPFTNTGFSGDTECLGTNTDYLGPALSLGLVWRP